MNDNSIISERSRIFLEYMAAEIYASLAGHDIFTIEEQIRHYTLKYNALKEFDNKGAFDGLLKVVLYQMKKIVRDHCE